MLEDAVGSVAVALIVQVRRGRMGGDQNVLCVLEYVQMGSPFYYSTRWPAIYGMHVGRL